MHMRWFLAILFGLTLIAGCGKKDDMPGQRTLAVFDVPTEDLGKMAEGKSSDAFSHAWTSEPLKLSVTDNPLVAVIEYEGHTTAAGPAANVFEFSWEREQGGSPVNMLAFTLGSDAKENQPYQHTAATRPFSFKKAETVAVSLRLDKHYGMAPDKVRIAIRSGISSRWWENLLALRWLLVGVVMAALMILFRR